MLTGKHALCAESLVRARMLESLANLYNILGKRKGFQTMLQGHRDIYYLINEEQRFSKRSGGYTILILFVDSRIDTSAQ